MRSPGNALLDGLAQGLAAELTKQGAKMARVFQLNAQNQIDLAAANQRINRIAQGVDAIVTFPLDANATRSGRRRANKAGIPIFTFSRPSAYWTSPARSASRTRRAVRRPARAWPRWPVAPARRSSCPASRPTTSKQPSGEPSRVLTWWRHDDGRDPQQPAQPQGRRARGSAHRRDDLPEEPQPARSWSSTTRLPPPPSLPNRPVLPTRYSSPRWPARTPTSSRWLKGTLALDLRPQCGLDYGRWSDGRQVSLRDEADQRS